MRADVTPKPVGPQLLKLFALLVAAGHVWAILKYGFAHGIFLAFLITCGVAIAVWFVTGFLTLLIAMLLDIRRG